MWQHIDRVAMGKSLTSSEPQFPYLNTRVVVGSSEHLLGRDFGLGNSSSYASESDIPPCSVRVL